MSKFEIVKRLVEAHNRIVQISVSGESAILIADTIKDLRGLLAELQNDVNHEEAAKEEVKHS